MLWFDKCGVWIRRPRETGIKLTSQVSILLYKSRWKVSLPQLASWQRAHAGPPPGDISLRYPFFSASVPEGWLASPRRVWPGRQWAPFQPWMPILFFFAEHQKRIIHDVFSMV